MRERNHTFIGVKAKFNHYRGRAINLLKYTIISTCILPSLSTIVTTVTFRLGSSEMRGSGDGHRIAVKSSGSSGIGLSIMPTLMQARGWPPLNGPIVEGQSL